MNETFMKEKPVLPLLLSMALPNVVSMLVNSLYNIVDSLFVARISEDAMTALSLGYPIQNLANAIAIGFGIGINAVFDVGWGLYVLAFLLLVGTTNAVNLTDGLDGLVSFVSLPVTMVFAFIAYMQGMLDLSGFSLGLSGACLGCLLVNRHPARVFMGATGSLALGGAIAALALLTRTELLLVIVGGIYVAEALSVIIQVTYFRFSGGKRIFRMSPLHHHFELGGWPEVKVVRVFTAVSCVLSVIGLWLWLNAFVLIIFCFIRFVANFAVKGL